MTTLPYSPPDMDTANTRFGAMCGHGALAAALGVPVLHVMPLFEKSGWINIPMMKTAIENAGRTARRCVLIPEQGAGVILVQWVGPWMSPGVPPFARNAYRHWIAFHDGLAWDSNLARWTPLAEWQAWLPELYPPRATGHEIAGVWLLNPQ